MYVAQTARSFRAGARRFINSWPFSDRFPTVFRPFSGRFSPADLGLFRRADGLMASSSQTPPASALLSTINVSEHDDVCIL